jgi:hypothetical protein
MLHLHTSLAYRPFLDPLDLHDHWVWLLIPLVYAIALVYKTLKLPVLRKPFREAASLSAYILIVMALAAVAIHLLNEWV